MVTPVGVMQTRRLPGSGAGPAPGSPGARCEGHARRAHRSLDALQAADVSRLGVGTIRRLLAAVARRALAQSGCTRATGRLLDPLETCFRASATDGTLSLVLGFESADHPLQAWMMRALELVRDHGASSTPMPSRDRWRRKPRRAPQRRRRAWREPSCACPTARPGRGTRHDHGHLRDGRSPGIASSLSIASVKRRGGPLRAQRASRRCCPAASRTFTQTGRAVLHAGVTRHGRRQRGRCTVAWRENQAGRERSRWSRTAARSPITTPSAAITAAVTSARYRASNRAMLAAAKRVAARRAS